MNLHAVYFMKIQKNWLLLSDLQTTTFQFFFLCDLRALYRPLKVRWCLSLINMVASGVLNGAPERNRPLSARKSLVAGPIVLWERKRNNWYICHIPAKNS